MKSNKLICFAPLWLLLAAAQLIFAGDAPPQTAARHALDLLLSSQFAPFAELLSPEAQKILTINFLQDRTAAEIKSFGKVESIGEPLVAKSGANDFVSFPVHFSITTVNVQFTLNPAGRISGLFFRSPEEPLPPVWNRPAYSRPEAFRERSVTIGSDDWKLGGILTVPAGKTRVPGLVLVHGPGPNDRDESIFSSRIFADLAEGLASRGIAVLRYDKRSRVYGPQMSAMAFTLKEETIEDAERAITLLRQQPEVDPKRIFVLGHSLGGYALPRIIKQDGKVAGAIFFAANARHIEDVSVAQTESILAANGGASPDEQKRLELMKGEAAKIRALKAGQETPAILLGLPIEYFLDLRSYDAPAEAQSLNVPLLFLQGGRDFQVTKTDFELWKTALASAKNASFHRYSMLNHLFITGDGPSTPFEYKKGGNVSPAVIDDISSWIEKP